ncbi:hypothetical protein [uncultured Marinobacter sp.]|uniref:hypothetical protein n=1 Tax=uncultured Marinobacter sp. TaxID=187379 RepID=UPI0030DB4E63
MNQDQFEAAYAKAHSMRSDAIKQARNPGGGYFNYGLNMAYQGWLLAQSKRATGGPGASSTACDDQWRGEP